MQSPNSTTTLFSLFSLLPLLSPLLLLLLTSPACHSVDVARLCQARCYYGRGGNLCNCNAFHFAGKRAVVDDEEGDSLPKLSSGSLVELTLQGGKHVPPHWDSSTSLENSRLPPSGGRREERWGEQGRSEEDRGERGELFEEEAPRGNTAAEEAVNRLTSLIRTALDERLIEDYDAGSRKRKQSTLPYAEADFVY